MYLQVVSLSPSLFKIKTSVVHIYQSVYKGMLLPNSISPSLCTVCICTQHICVFVCPLIPNLNICPTSPHNIGPLARPCPLETAINSVLFFANSRSPTYDKEARSEVGRVFCENTAGKQSCHSAQIC